MKKKLLIITNNPERASFRQRIGVYLGRLKESGIDCRVEKLPRGFFQRLKLFRLAGEFDGVFVHKKRFNFFDSLWLRKYSSKVIYDFDDALYASEPTGKRFRVKKPGAPYTKRCLKRIIQAADHVIAGNDTLAIYAGSLAKTMTVLPTPVVVPETLPEKKAEEDGPVIGWIGTGRNLVYLDGIRDVIRAVAHRYPQVRWRVISSEPFCLDGVPIQNVRWEASTADRALSEFDIGLMPLTDDPWSRGKCSFKVLQYMAAGIPTIASPVGMNTELIRDGVTGCLAGESEEWIIALTALIDNSALRARLGKNGYRFVKERFTLDVCWQKMKGVLEPYMNSRMV